MSTEDIKGSLLYGEDIEYEGILIRNYKLKEIFSKRNGLGLDKYNYLISLAILEVKDILKDSKIDNIKDLKMYDIICTDFEFNRWFIEFLNTFTYLEWEYVVIKEFVAYEDNDINKKRFRMNKAKFDGFMEIMKQIYSVGRNKSKSKFDPSKAVDEETRKIVEELAEAERIARSKKKKGNVTLSSIINQLSAKENSYSLLNIWDLTVYQVMMQYYGTEQNENYEYILDSVYHGVFDLKKSGTNLESIFWANELNV